MDPLTLILFGLAMTSKNGHAPSLDNVHPPVPPGPMPGPMPGPVPGPAAPPPSVVTPPAPAPPMPPWPAPVVPSSLPPFPGPGWVADTPVSPAVVARAEYWNPKLWDFPSKRIVQPFVTEQFGGRWLTFKAAWHPGDQGPQTFMATEAYRLATAQPVAPAPTPAPAPLPGPSVNPIQPMPNPAQPPTPAVVVQPAVPPVPPAAPVGPPPLVSPYPGTGAWQSNSAYIARYQNALTWLASSAGHPEWNPGGVDGKFGPNTQAAVKAFEAAHGLAADGECGPQCAAALDAMLTGQAQPAPPGPVVVPPMPIAPAPPPVIPVVVTPLPVPIPPAVQPYPGTGAWQSNAAYIARYQAALSYLATATGNPSWNPQGIDGKFGPNTQSAVKAFEAAHGLTQDGECGPSCAAAIDAMLVTAHAGQAGAAA